MQNCPSSQTLAAGFGEYAVRDTVGMHAWQLLFGLLASCATHWPAITQPSAIGFSQASVASLQPSIVQLNASAQSRMPVGVQVPEPSQASPTLQNIPSLQLVAAANGVYALVEVPGTQAWQSLLSRAPLLMHAPSIRQPVVSTFSQTSLTSSQESLVQVRSSLQLRLALTTHWPMALQASVRVQNWPSSQALPMVLAVYAVALVALTHS